MTEPAHKNVYAALLAAQREMGPIRKDHTATLESKSGKGFQYKYADLGEVIEVITDTLIKHGLVFTQPLGIIDGQSVLYTRIIHAESDDERIIESVTPLICKDPSDPQKVGGAITYFRRYSLLSLLGLAPEDDDGQKASTPAPPAQRREQKAYGNGTPQPERMVSWSLFWKWARDNGFQTKADIERFLGGTMPDDPQVAKDTLDSLMPEPEDA